MLAQSFKSAHELNLTEQQHDALIKTLALMEGGKIRHIREIDSEEFCDVGKRRFVGLFNMTSWCDNYECGSVACMGGTAELIAGVPPDSLFMNRGQIGALGRLFYPTVVPDWDEINVERAACALRSYLTTGEPDWESAL